MGGHSRLARDGVINESEEETMTHLYERAAYGFCCAVVAYLLYHLAHVL